MGTKPTTTTSTTTTSTTTTTTTTTTTPFVEVFEPMVNFDDDFEAKEVNAAEGPGDDERKNKYGNNNNNSGGQAYGDPHFMVATAGQDAVCFDFNPVGGTEMTLLIDPESSLSISATAENRENGKTFMNSVHFASPEGAHLEFDIDGVHLAGLGDQEPTAKHPLT